MKRRLMLTSLFATLALACASVRADVAQEWTDIARTSISRATADASSRQAMLKQAEIAIAQARSGGNGGFHGNGASGTNGGSKSERESAAIAVAAFVVLERLLPEQREELESRLAVTFSRIPETDAKAAGAVLGRQIALGLQGCVEITTKQKAPGVTGGKFQPLGR